jgi:superfamily II DNA or RNA helicase
VLTRFSSRRAQLGDFLPNQLQGAKAYDRIAGYFSSSLLEVAGEAISQVEGQVRIVCNSDLQRPDIVTAGVAQAAMRREWCASVPDDVPAPFQERLKRLHELLVSGKLRVKVLPDERFGLIHGKAGVITRCDGSQVCFLGSVNESKRAWKLNYELVWMDDSPEGVEWVQEEFDALWHCNDAFDLADAVIQDIGRLAKRKVITSIEDWKNEGPKQSAEAAIELPVYRRDNGLWAHQKSFVKLAFEAHQSHGARFVLADQVGLGKTVQLGLAAKLMALSGDRPVLIMCPKPLMWQWQAEMWNLLKFPVAVWNGRQWVDENGIEHAATGWEGLRKCPRRAGIVSTGLVKRKSEAVPYLEGNTYECVILDEAHHARRRNLGGRHQNDSADMTNLYQFMFNVSPRTRSMLLATATPVQIDPIEAWDLLSILAHGNEYVLGDMFSNWRRKERLGLSMVIGKSDLPTEVPEVWDWTRDPMPPANEAPTFGALRSRLDMKPTDWVAAGSRLEDLSGSDRRRLEGLQTELFEKYHPYIRTIVRRTRGFLESTIDLKTNEPYLKPVHVRLHGDRIEDSIILPAFLERAYHHAEDFCARLGERKGFYSGFLRTMLLRRVGSTIEAGRRTALMMLQHGLTDSDLVEDDDSAKASALYPLNDAERAPLQMFADSLAEAQDEDPKLNEVMKKLDAGWLELGCIIFSQYFDSAYWLVEKLSARYPKEPVAIYAGGNKSGVMRGGSFTPLSRDEIKAQVQLSQIRLLIGTDAASEGLNLQRLGTLINLDLPWNPTRLEQRKGRIQRIGQVRDTVDVYNMRYRGSVEDRVHQLLSKRLNNIMDMFGQIPDTLEDVWVEVAHGDIKRAQEVIDEVPPSHPFEMRYDRIEDVEWETCARVLDSQVQLQALRRGWSDN